MPMNPPARAPEKVLLHRKTRSLELRYADGSVQLMPFEYLRVYSPSAEVRGHGGGEPMLVPGKRNVGINRIEPVGNYALRLVFDDGHDSGLYSWSILQELAADQARLWPHYLERLQREGLSRDSDVIKLSTLPKKYKPASRGD